MLLNETPAAYVYCLEKLEGLIYNLAGQKERIKGFT